MSDADLRNAAKNGDVFRQRQLLQQGVNANGVDKVRSIDTWQISKIMEHMMIYDLMQAVSYGKGHPNDMLGWLESHLSVSQTYHSDAQLSVEKCSGEVRMQWLSVIDGIWIS